MVAALAERGGVWGEALFGSCDARCCCLVWVQPSQEQRRSGRTDRPDCEEVRHEVPALELGDQARRRIYRDSVALYVRHDSYRG